MAVRIVTDSTADLPPETARELGVSVVPLTVIFGEESFLEGIDMSTELFYERLVESKELPKTSAPSTGQFIEAYENALKEADEILSIHISSKLSATWPICRCTRRPLPFDVAMPALSWPRCCKAYNPR